MLASSWVVIAKNYGPHTKWDWSWIENEYGYHASASAAGIYGTNVPTLLSAANLKSTGLIYQNKAFTDKHTESNKRQPLVMNDSFLKRKAKQSIKICLYYIYIVSLSSSVQAMNVGRVRLRDIKFKSRRFYMQSKPDRSL